MGYGRGLRTAYFRPLIPVRNFTRPTMSGVVLFGLPRVTIVSIRRIHGGNAMTQANLTETLFKPRFKHPETSTLVRRFNPGTMPAVQSALDGKNVPTGTA